MHSNEKRLSNIEKQPAVFQKEFVSFIEIIVIKILSNCNTTLTEH